MAILPGHVLCFEDILEAAVPAYQSLGRPIPSCLAAVGTTVIQRRQLHPTGARQESPQKKQAFPPLPLGKGRVAIVPPQFAGADLRASGSKWTACHGR